MKNSGLSEEGVARHAKVVPAFVAATIHRPLESWVGEVLPAELLRWRRKGDLSDSARRELRQAIVRRTRVRAERLWSQPTGVRLVEGWRDCLSNTDRKRIEALPLAAGKPLEAWTLREVKEALRVPLEHTLDLLARLEAIYWQPPPAVTARPLELASVGLEPPVKATPELHDLVRAVSELPWVTKVSRHDLRFAYAGEASLPDWAVQLLSQDTVPAALPRLLERVLAADKLTAEAEAEAIAQAAARECAPRNGGPDTSQRWVSMLMRRHISRLGAGRTLAEVGEEFGVTRERIRQICEEVENLFAEAEIATPSLDRVLRAAARVSPAQVADLDEQLRRFIGEGAGIEALVSWAQVLGREDLPVVCERVRTRVRGQLVEVTVVQAPDAPPWVEAMIRHVSRDSSMFGCTNVLRIAGRLALKEGLAPGQEAIEAALEAAAGFRWLDPQSGWFTLGDSSGCSAASRLRKIMAVAQDTVGTDEIAGALAGDDMWMYREATSLGLATPPVHVLRELFLGWPWLKVVQKSRFVAGPGLDLTDALSDVERAIADVVGDHDGVACRFELKEVVMGRLGLTDVLLAATLGSSPIVERVEHGLYRVRGRRMGDGALSAARRRLRERATPAASVPLDCKANEFFVRVTEASLRNEQYYVPVTFHAQLAGKRHRVVDQAGEEIGEARVGQTGSMAGLNRLFPGRCSGDQFRVEVLENALKVRHCPGHAGPGAQATHPTSSVAPSDGAMSAS